MATKKRATQTPGASTAEGAAAPAAAKAPEAIKAPKLESTKDLPPAIVAAVENADKMTYAQASTLAAEGKLNNRVLTEKGWYVPPTAEPKVG